MKIYVTKYALTQGILELEQIDKCENYVQVISPFGGHAWVPKADIETDRDCAVTKAETMRDRKIDSLKKQIAKLEKMRF